MLEAYSKNQTLTAGQAISFTGVSLKKGCTAELISPTTIALNMMSSLFGITIFSFQY